MDRSMKVIRIILLPLKWYWYHQFSKIEKTLKYYRYRFEQLQNDPLHAYESDKMIQKLNEVERKFKIMKNNYKAKWEFDYE